MKQWESATRKLINNLFDSGLDKLRMFLSKLKTRLLVTGWTTICDINGKSIFDAYGMINHDECIDNAKTYYVLDASGNMMDSRARQMSQQMIVCIKQSITDEWA